MKVVLNRITRLQSLAAQFLLGIPGLAVITFVSLELGFGLQRAAFAYVILVALSSTLGSFSSSLLLSLLAVACLSYFFAPPRFDLRVDGADDVVRIATFFTTSIIVIALTSNLKRVKREFVDSKARLEQAQQIAHVGWWERDFSTGHVTLSEEARRIFGVEPLDLPKWHGRWLGLIHPEDQARVADAAAAAILPGGPRYDVEYRVIRPDRTQRAVHSQGDVTWDKSGKPLRQFGVMQDITELRQAEREIRASEARFRTFADQAADAFFLLDDNSTILDVNRHACENLGYNRQALIGKHRSDFDVGLDEASIRGLKQRIVTEEAVTFETRHRRKDGTSFPVEVRVGQFEQGGRRFLCLARDITERKRAEDELRASEERFRTLVQFSFDVYWESDEQHRFVRQEFAEGLSDAPAPGSEIGKNSMGSASRGA